jgi:ABC-type Fe3+-hydroxamate transport system substrate-binding protein
LVPSLTELLVDLGLKEYIVGITKFCVHPTELRKEKTIVGGTKNPKIEAIAFLKPDIILCNKEENTKEIVRVCSEISTVHVSDIYTIEDTIALIEMYGALFDCSPKAAEIIKNLKDKIENFKQFLIPKKQLNVAYFIWKNPWMVAANNTFINHLLALNKFDNIFKNLERYPEVQILELEKKEDLALILLSSEPYPFKEKHITELQISVGKIKIILADGELFSWYGTRLLHSFEYFKHLRIAYENSLSK